MSDYRNMGPDFLDSEDPFRRDSKMNPDVNVAYSAWGWIGGAIFLLILLALGFGIWGRPPVSGINTASNDTTQPAVTRMAPPAPMPAPTMAPAPAMPASPVTPAPSAPGPAGNAR